MTIDPAVYRAPGARDPRPAVIFWFRVYAVSAPLVHLALVVGWALAVPTSQPSPLRTLTASPVVSLLAFGGLAALHGAAALVPYRPWGWTVGLVVLAVGLSSASALAALPVLVLWLRPETRAAFGRLR